MATSLKRSYAFINPKGERVRTFYSLKTAWRFLRGDSPDLVPRDLVGNTVNKPLRFADGFSFYRAN